MCLKRKIRNYVQDVKEDESGWRIYIKDQVPLNRSDLEAGEALGLSLIHIYRVERVCDAVKRSAETGRWVTVND